MTNGSDLTEAATVGDGGLDVSQNIFVQRQPMFTVPPMVNNASSNTGLSEAPRQPKLFFFTTTIAMDDESRATRNWGRQYDTRYVQSISLNSFSLDVHNYSSILMPNRRLWLNMAQFRTNPVNCNKASFTAGILR
jgi:hypothetical protein